MGKKQMKERIESKVKSFCKDHDIRNAAIQGLITAGALAGLMLLAKGVKKVVKKIVNDYDDNNY